MSYYTIGTAGHVDHGKTTLVKALTGKETDRLKEEKIRGISIELGFAPFDLPDGKRVGIVDVPGHEKFVKQMLAGVAGIDLVLLIIAADEGIMPQTVEHLDILNLLHIDKGIVVITKADLVDEEWLELVKEDIKETTDMSVLKNAPVVEVSSTTGKGIDKLVKLIQQGLEEVQVKEAVGRSRMPIDRVFSVTGFGTVVTGTVWSGKIKVGEQMSIFPDDYEVRIRNIQIHGDQVKEANAGQRAAVNLGNISVEDVSRGAVLSEPGLLTPSHRIDVKLKLLDSWDKALKHQAPIRLHLGTNEVIGTVHLLENDELEPGSEAFAQIVTEEPIVALRGDNFVIRFYSPVITIGGGLVIDGNAKKLKRFRSENIRQLELKLKGSPLDLIEQYLDKSGYEYVEKLMEKIGLTSDQLTDAIEKGVAQEQLISFEGKQSFLLSTSFYERTLEKSNELIGQYHRKYPLRRGMGKEELKGKLEQSIEQKVFNNLLERLVQEGKLLVSDQYVSLPNHKPQPSEKEQKIIVQIEQDYGQGEFQPPTIKEVMEKHKLNQDGVDEIFNYLVERRVLVKASEDIYFHSNTIDLGKEILRQMVDENKEITLAEVRDRIKSSRKYVLPLLEYYDHIKYTKRIGDKRVLY